MPTKAIDIRDAQHQLAELLQEAAAGVDIVIVDGQQPRARLVPVEPTNSRRIAGLHPGSMTTTPDFDAPLPDEFWTGTP
jgi:antitoxin (DNA-binding transcriptional repressor) of toxin-antitoxin stability system